LKKKGQKRHGPVEMPVEKKNVPAQRKVQKPAEVG